MADASAQTSQPTPGKPVGSIPQEDVDFLSTIATKLSTDTADLTPAQYKAAFSHIAGKFAGAPATSTEAASAPEEEPEDELAGGGCSKYWPCCPAEYYACIAGGG